MIGGNTQAIIQIKQSSKNAFGEKVTEWVDIATIKGFLDYTVGDASYKSNFKGDVAETSHIFICDYTELAVEPTQCRLVSDSKIYDVLLIDDPMGLHKHLEFMLKYNEVIK